MNKFMTPIRLAGEKSGVSLTEQTGISGSPARQPYSL